jgi:hypothetical protein
MRSFPAALVMLFCATAPAAADEDPLGNWFNDPFMAVRKGMSDCPAPLGPLMPRSQMVTEEHSRVERGTSCWLAGKCEKPNAYMYDAQIGAQLAKRFASTDEFARASLWVTVKRKFVWVEGCTQGDIDADIERFVRATAGVEMVFVDVRRAPGARIPYKVAKP